MTLTAPNLDRSVLVPPQLTGPLFVLSVWRSGSSLLYTLLNQHSQIALLYEGDLPRLHRFLWGRFHSGAWRERWEFWNQGPSRHGIAIDSMPANVSSAWEATRLVYQEVARRKQATVWGEKTPHWFDCPLQMAENFPDARFIFLWRDPNSIMTSIARAARTERFFKKAGFTQRMLLGTENLRNASDALKAQGRPVHEINYEDLTVDPTACMQQVCSFLDIPFEERMTTLEGADRSAIASGAHHSMVRSGRIVGGRKRAEILAPALQVKIGRYIARWEQRSHGAWPKYPVKRPEGVARAGRAELCLDRIIYQSVLCRDKFVALVYAVVPVNFGRRFRAWLKHRSLKRALLPTSS